MARCNAWVRPRRPLTWTERAEDVVALACLGSILLAFAYATLATLTGG